MKRIDSEPAPHLTRPLNGRRPLQLASLLAAGAMLLAGSAHALPPGELVADAARQTQRTELRRMLSSGTEDRREASGRRLSAEERQSLRRDVRNAARGAYPEQPDRKQKRR
jgi:hypothetical protein